MTPTTTDDAHPALSLTDPRRTTRTSIDHTIRTRTNRTTGARPLPGSYVHAPASSTTHVNAVTKEFHHDDGPHAVPA